MCDGGDPGEEHPGGKGALEKLRPFPSRGETWCQDPMGAPRGLAGLLHPPLWWGSFCPPGMCPHKLLTRVVTAVCQGFKISLADLK